MSSIPPLDEQDPPEPRGSERRTESVAAPARPRRPRYLVVAILMALVFGAGCWTEGCGRLAFYRSEVDLGAAQNAAVPDEADRGRAESLYQRFMDATEQQKGRAIPLAAATFVLGAALLALGSRSMSGRLNTRKILIQLVAAQAIVVGASFFATREIRHAELDWQLEHTLMMKRPDMQPGEYAQFCVAGRSVGHALPTAWLVFRSLASLLIIVALTRPRARAFFDSAATPSPATE